MVFICKKLYVFVLVLGWLVRDNRKLCVTSDYGSVLIRAPKLPKQHVLVPFAPIKSLLAANVVTLIESVIQSNNDVGVHDLVDITCTTIADPFRGCGGHSEMFVAHSKINCLSFFKQFLTIFSNNIYILLYYVLCIFEKRTVKVIFATFHLYLGCKAAIIYCFNRIITDFRSLNCTMSFKDATFQPVFNVCYRKNWKLSEFMLFY